MTYDKKVSVLKSPEFIFLESEMIQRNVVDYGNLGERITFLLLLMERATYHKKRTIRATKTITCVGCVAQKSPWL